MWTWTCTACGDVSEGATQQEARGKFFAHVAEKHSTAKVVLSVDPTEGD